jgi:mRNA-degrading endonuclease toxin of MazEF toxin-antitoxin module
VPSIKWNVYIAEIGFIENNSSKLRPVIVISEPVGDHNIVLVAPIYSAKYEHVLKGDITISDDYKDLGLVRPSTIRLHRIAPISTSDLKEQLGHAPLKIQESAIVELKKLLDL